MPALQQLPISKLTAHLSRHDLQQMLRLVRITFRLSQNPDYRELVFPQLPEVCTFDPGHAGLMMGYDFHLTPEGPRLIEVNTNAGGAYIAWLSEAQAAGHDPIQLSPRVEQRLLHSFHREWQDFFRSDRPLQQVVLMDEDPEDQPLYPEVVACRDWLCQQGINAQIADPAQLDVKGEGVFLKGKKVDLIYNRHCDFFLEDPPLAKLRQAYLAGLLCLSPNPLVYGLLADKRRMVLWSDRQGLGVLGMSDAEQQLLLTLVPQSRLLADCDLEQLWAERKELAFKPVTRFGSRGVLLGKSVSRKRFAEMDPDTTLVQKLVPPSVETDDDGQEFKVDLRLFVYRDRLLGIGARLYQGQVTNLRTEGGGFAPVRLTP